MNHFKLRVEDLDKKYLDILISKHTKIYNKDDYFNLNEIKNKIDSREWDKNKKFSNNYELIHIPNKRKIYDGIALHEPLSRSYFKMVEMIHDFNLLENSSTNFRSAHMAEGPGGFMEATYKISHNCKKFNNFKHYGITLYSDNKDVPGWSKAINFIQSDKDIIIDYGIDGSGNIYNPDNIIHFSETCGYNSCDLVTADGGFDYSLDFNKQEELSYKLIYCEIVTCMFIQKKGGSFICKIFDTFRDSTLKLLFFLCCFYEEVYLNKPLTSRPANSEKYIIAKKFRGIDINYLSNLLNIIRYWNVIEKNMNISDIFGGILPEYFVNSMMKYNKINSKHQISIINNTIEIIKNKKKLSFLNKIIDNQIKQAKEWCKKYEEDINLKSSFIQGYKKNKF